MIKLSARIAVEVKKVQALHDAYVSDPLAHFEQEIEADYMESINECGVTLQGPYRAYVCYDARVLADSDPAMYRCGLIDHADAFELCSLDAYIVTQQKIYELEGLEKMAITAEDDLEESKAQLTDLLAHPCDWFPQLEGEFNRFLYDDDPAFCESMRKDGLGPHLSAYSSKLKVWLSEYDWQSCDTHFELVQAIEQAELDLSSVEKEFLELIEE